MNRSEFATLSVRRRFILLAAALAVALSWTDCLDNASEHYLDNALIAGGVVYATARGINAAVSLVMGTEITPAVATFSVGQVLDPIDDLIERFSALMLVALGSLALQKIMLEILSHQGFSILATALGTLLLLTALSQKYSRLFPVALKLFTLTVAIRFFLSVVVLASAAVDYTFFEEGENEKHRKMEALQGELTALSSTRPGVPTEEELASARRELAALIASQSAQQESLASLRDQLNGLRTALESTRSNIPITCRLNPLCDEGNTVNAAKLNIAAKERELEAAELVSGSIASTIDEKSEYLECAQLALAGESCSFWGRAYSLVSPTAWLERFNKVGASMNDYVNDIISLLMSFLIKTVLIPLLFLYSLIRLYKRILKSLIET